MTGVDVITSDKSLSPFGVEDLSKILDLISHLQGAQNFSYTVMITINARQRLRQLDVVPTQCVSLVCIDTTSSL
jgi:hypothetical protein